MLQFYLGGVIATFLLGYIFIKQDQEKLDSFDYLDIFATAIFWIPVLVYYFCRTIMGGKQWLK